MSFSQFFELEMAFIYELKSWEKHGTVTDGGKIKFKWSLNLITSCYSTNAINNFNNNQKSFLASQFTKYTQMYKLFMPSH